MTVKRMLTILCASALLLGLATGCGKSDEPVKIGVSLGVGAASRWEIEKTAMEERAQEQGAQIEVRLNRTDTPLTQTQDCIEMIDGGIDVLILTPRDASKVDEILDYAKSKKVPVISYARVVLGRPVDLFVGYDSTRIGQRMGLYLTELVYEGDYIILSGDEGDNNAKLLAQGALHYIDPIRSKINVILETSVPGWSPEEAERMVKEAVAANGGHVDAIFAPNDKLAGAAAKALEELGVTEHVAITGMDAELAALQRIVAGTQECTIYMDLEELANTAVDEAIHLGRGEKVTTNADYDNQSGGTIPANLITGRLVTKENLDKLMIESGFFTREEIYGG